MKKLVFLAMTLLLIASCDLNDDSVNYSFDVLPVESVDIPDEFALGETYPIKVYYNRPSSCHAFNDFYYRKENNERTVAIIAVDYDRSDCEDLEDELTSSTINFNVTGNGSYIFKFWQGGNNYMVVEVPVVD